MLVLTVRPQDFVRIGTDTTVYIKAKGKAKLAIDAPAYLEIEHVKNGGIRQPRRVTLTDVLKKEASCG